MSEPKDYPCHLDAPHPPHLWYPLVEDPDNAQVLHLGLGELPCPGISTADWLASRD